MWARTRWRYAARSRARTDRRGCTGRGGVLRGCYAQPPCVDGPCHVDRGRWRQPSAAWQPSVVLGRPYARRCLVHTTRSGWRALVAALTAAILLVALIVAPVAAVTDGTPDGDDHPYVGLMTAHASDGDYMHRCTGTLISPTVFVTAGHCTFGADYAVVYFEAGPIEPDPDYDPVTRSCDDEDIEGYPCAGGVTR